jgi:hypothetical protein
MPQRNLNGNKKTRKNGHHHSNGAARPIRNKRDYTHAAGIIGQLKQEADQESEAELRLQALLHELEKYDDDVDDFESDFTFEEEYDGPLRRWSDDPNDLD